MIKEGMFVRCPIDMEDPSDPRTFATGKVISVDDFNETAHIKFGDPFNYKQFFEFIPDEVAEAPLSMLDHCHIFKGSMIKCGRKKAHIIEYKLLEEGEYEYYLQDDNTKEFFLACENEIDAPFTAGDANPVHQLKRYEFQNPCWYLGRQIVKKTMNILDNSIYGFRELAGCKIYLKAFQINTIMLCLQSDPCRYMIADEVGLGKTIEASSVLKIYLNNKSENNALIVVPSALLAQWKTEMFFKFDLLEGQNENGNTITFMSIEDLDNTTISKKWDFVIADEVHNYIKDDVLYRKIHTLSKNAKNILLLSATPIQQRKEEYLKLLRLIIPNTYDTMSIDQFSNLVERQNRISRITYSLLDEIDSFKNELLPEVEEEDPHDNEDVQDELEEINDDLEELADIIGDTKLSAMIAEIDTSKNNFGLYDIQVAISYVCDNYQLERNIIRGRRAVLGVYPKDSEAEFAERKLVELTYKVDQEENYYESEAYRTLTEWIATLQGDLSTSKVIEEIEPLLETLFSSPWAYVKQLEKYGTDIPEDVRYSANRWLEDENQAIENLADLMDDPAQHPSRLIKIISYIDTELFGKKIVIFTDYEETFNAYYKTLVQAFGDEEVTGFTSSIDKDQAEINIYKFQSVPNCHMLVCDRFGGEGRNLQIADYVVHVDLPWDINTIEQRIGRLDRLGRDVEVPVTSVVIHSMDSYEEQLFNFWNKGLNVFQQSLSGLEIIMNDINMKIVESIKNDFEFGLYRLIPELIEEAGKMRETVHREQIFDTVALRYRPLYVQLEKLLSNYQFNENSLFANTMMSWASLAGFGSLRNEKEPSMVSFDERNFSIRSAQNSFLLPPNWDNYLSKKQNALAIRVQRGYEEETQKNVTHSDRAIKGTFNRDIAIKNDYIHFYAPGDEVFDCIVNNALNSYRGMCAAFAVQSSINWKGFVYTYSIAPNERLLIDNGISLHALGSFRQYLASSLQSIPVAFMNYAEAPEKVVMYEYDRITKMGYFNQSDAIEHLGRRGRRNGFLGIRSRYSISNIEWFREQYPLENWESLVEKSSSIAKSRAKKRFSKGSNLSGAKEMIDQILSSRESREKYYETNPESTIEELKEQYRIIYESLKKPVVRLESASFVWMIKV